MIAIFALAIATVAPIVPATPATPATFAKVLLAAKGGDRIVLEAGAWPAITISRRNFTPPLVIDAAAATFPRTSISIFDSSGIDISGGSYGPCLPACGIGVWLRRSARVSITGAKMTGLNYGITADQSSDVAITSNRIDGVRVDGVRFFNSSHGIISRNAFIGAALAPGSAAHPDAVQLSGDTAQTTDVVIEDNHIMGDTQGVTMFNGGKGQFGYARIAIRRNIIAISFPQALAMYNCTDCIATGNTIITLPRSWKYSAFNFPGSAGLFRADNLFIDNRVRKK